MSELKVNKVSPQSGTDFTLGDSGDTFTVPSGATLTVAGTFTQTGTQTFDGGVDIDNFNINGTTITLSSGDMTLDVAGDIILDADGGDVFVKDAGTTFGSLTNTSGNLIIKSGTTTAATFSGANVTLAGTVASGAITSSAGLIIADAGNIGSASDTDAIAIAADGVVTFSQVPLLPDNTVATADIQADAITGAKIADDAINSEHYTDGSIDTAHIADGQITTAKLATAVFTGATDIGAAIVDADLLLMDDGAGGTIRKSVMSRLKTYIGAEANTPSFYAYGSGATSIANDTLTKIAVASEQFDNGGCYNATSSSATLNSLTAPAYAFTPTVAGLYFFVGAIKMNTANFNVGLVNNIGGTGGTETYLALVYGTGIANNTVVVSGYSVMNGSGNNVCLTGYQASGGSINTNNALYTTYFGGFLVKAS